MSEDVPTNGGHDGPESVTDGVRSIGPMLQRLREQAGRSQADQAFVLSDISGRPVTRNDVSRWENEGRLIGSEWQAAFATSFNIPKTELHRAVIYAKSTRRKQNKPSDQSPVAGHRSPEKSERNSATGGRLAELPASIQAYIPVLRNSLDLFDLPEDGAVAHVDELRKRTARLVRWRLNSEYARLAAELRTMLPELTRALFASDAHARAEVAALLVQSYRAADAIADKFGLYDLSARTIGVMDWAARQAESMTTTAISAYVRGETFFASSQFSPGRRILEKAAETVQVGGSTGESAAYGALHMRAAVLAARAGESDYAREHLGAARDAARCVSEGIYGGTAFGPGSVRIHEVSLAISLHDPASALTAAGDWEPPASLPAERRSHFYVDLARAQLLTDRFAPTLESLGKAWTVAPEHVRAHPDVLDMLPRLTRQGGMIESETRDFCRRANIAIPS